MAEPRVRIDRYEIQEVIGRGAMGVVYRAVDPVIGRVVALKTIHRGEEGGGSARPEALERFAREARAAGLLSHPNIVTVYDVGSSEDGSLSYIAMEFVEGRTLREIVPAGRRMTGEEALDVGLQVARALDYAHRRGIVHRDVKPANILVREDGLVKLADFGVALIESSDLTRTGQSVGSPSYIAPELLQGASADRRSDLFSLGVILYELLSGCRPFSGETLAALYHRIVSFDPPPPSAACSELPADWDAIVGRLLAKKPEERYESASQLIEDLRAVETGRPLRHAGRDAVGSGTAASGFAGDGEASPREPREADLDRVIEAGAGQPGGAAARGEVPHQAKAILSLVAIAGFALAIILSAAVLRQALGEGAAPRPAPAAAVEAPAPAPADLTVRLAHNLKAGRLRITMDDRALMSEPFTGERTRMRVQGSLSRRLEVAPGTHLFRVSVEEEGGRKWSASTTRDLREAGEATLFVEVKGLLKKELDLTWY